MALSHFGEQRARPQAADAVSFPLQPLREPRVLLGPGALNLENGGSSIFSLLGKSEGRRGLGLMFRLSGFCWT